MTRWRLALLGVVALAVLAVLVVLITPADRRSPAAHPSPSQTPTITRGAEYVAIGDSYTSAPANGPATAARGCLQTTTNYPHQVAARLGLKLHDVSCGGASTRELTGPQATGPLRQRPQADALSRATDLVTLSLGANDLGILRAVIVSCVGLGIQDPLGAPCERADTESGDSTLRKDMRVIEQALVDAIELVAHQAPGARIVVVGYPQFFPSAEEPCAQLPLARGDYAFARRFNTGLVRSQQRAAERTGVEYLDVFTASRGHDMCAPDPWIAGLHPTRTDAMPYHPYPEEQRLVADLLVDLLSRAPRPNRGLPADR
jgi:lysophospholipase L1-like esterase